MNCPPEAAKNDCAGCWKMDECKRDIRERLAELKRTAPARERVNLYGTTPTYRLRPRILEEPIPRTRIPIIDADEQQKHRFSLRRLK